MVLTLQEQEIVMSGLFDDHDDGALRIAQLREGLAAVAIVSAGDGVPGSVKTPSGALGAAAVQFGAAPPAPLRSRL